jgi:hypothetical protein
VKRLRIVFPELRILVGRWGPQSLAEENVQPLVVAGANHIGHSLVETRDELSELTELPRKRVLEEKSSANVVVPKPPPPPPPEPPRAPVPTDPEIQSIVK